MTAVSPENEERLSYPVQHVSGKWAADWSSERSREMQRAGVIIGKRSPERHPKAESISGSSVPQAANRPNLCGATTSHIR